MGKTTPVKFYLSRDLSALVRKVQEETRDERPTQTARRLIREALEHRGLLEGEAIGQD